MKQGKFEIKNVELVKENGNYYLDLTYQTEDIYTVKEVHVPRIKLPLDDSRVPEITHEISYASLRPNYRLSLNGISYPIEECEVDGMRIGYTVEIIEEKTQELTLAEIEKKLGYKVKIVSEGKKK